MRDITPLEQLLVREYGVIVGTSAVAHLLGYRTPYALAKARSRGQLLYTEICTRSPYNPNGWAFCNGAMLPLRQNAALYSLLGTRFGGDGQNTFQLPNLTTRAATSQGTGTGLSQRDMGETFGAAGVSLTLNELPAHTHDLVAYAQAAAKRLATTVSNGALSMPGSNAIKPFSNTPPNTAMAPNLLAPTGGGGAHENRQPYLAVNFCIALQGAFPYFE